MKHILLSISVAFACFACTEDSISINPDTQSVDLDKAYISVHVVAEDLAADNGGCVEQGAYIKPVENAEVSLFYLDVERPFSSAANLIVRTDKHGRAAFEDLPHGNYEIKVKSEYGSGTQKFRTLQGEVTKVSLRF